MGFSFASRPPPAHADDGGGGGGDAPFGFTEKSYGLTVLEELQILDGNFKARPLKQPNKLHKKSSSNLGGLQVCLAQPLSLLMFLEMACVEFFTFGNKGLSFVKNMHFC